MTLAVRSQEQAALSWELRAANSLASLRLKQGRVEPAREVRAPVYGRFTEGLDTADLIVARNLLENMNQLQPAMR